MSKRSGMFRIYAFRFASGFVPITNLYTLLFVEKQFTTFEISTLLASWSVAALLFEVPSGVVADKYDRRYVLCASQLCTAGAFVIWLTYPEFWGYFIGFVLWGVGGAFDSGTYDALVYDELAERDQASKYADVLGHSEAVYLIAVVSGFVCAALLVGNGFVWLLWSSLLMAIMGGGVALSLPKATRREDVADDEYFVLLKRGIGNALRVPSLARAVAVIAIGGCVTDVVTEYLPLFAADRDVTATAVAIIGATAVLLMVAAAAWAARLPGANLPASVQLMIAGGLLVAATWAPGWVAIAMFALTAAIANASWVLQRAAMQEYVESDVRATVTSVAGFSQEVLNVAGLFAIGVVADALTRTAAFRAVGIIVVLTALVLVIRDKRPVQSKH